jgi:hypothetical protein
MRRQDGQPSPFSRAAPAPPAAGTAFFLGNASAPTTGAEVLVISTVSTSVITTTTATLYDHGVSALCTVASNSMSGNSPVVPYAYPTTLRINAQLLY